MDIKTSTPSQLLLHPSRRAMANAQRQLIDAQVEVSTGRHANAMLTLGADTGVDISLRLQLSSAEHSLDIAKNAQVRAGVVQSSLSHLSKLADTYRSTLMGSRSAAGGQDMVLSAARDALDVLQATLNSSHDNQFIFGGLNSGTRPIADYSGTPRNSIIAAFEEEFGFPPDDPAASTLGASEIDAFIDGRFQALFENASWATTWSSATDEIPSTRLGSAGKIEVSCSIHAGFAQKMAAAFSMIDVIAESRLGQAALQATIDRSLVLIGEAESSIIMEQSRIGTGERRLKDAIIELEARRDHFTSSISALEGIDSYEAAARVNRLITELEASYALTARISKMSLLSYL